MLDIEAPKRKRVIARNNARAQTAATSRRNKRTKTAAEDKTNRISQAELNAQTARSNDVHAAPMEEEKEIEDDDDEDDEEDEEEETSDSSSSEEEEAEDEVEGQDETPHVSSSRGRVIRAPRREVESIKEGSTWRNRGWGKK